MRRYRSRLTKSLASGDYYSLGWDDDLEIVITLGYGEDEDVVVPFAQKIRARLLLQLEPLEKP